MKELIKKATTEIKENRRKIISNISKQIKDIEPLENTDFLNLVSVAISNFSEKKAKKQ